CFEAHRPRPAPDGRPARGYPGKVLEETRNMSDSTGLYQGCSMGDLVVRAIQRGGDRDAFILDDERISYREFGARLSRFIQALKARGLRHGDAVAAITSNRPEGFMVTAAAYLMGLRITWMHPMGSEDDHAYIVEDSGVKTLFVDHPTFTARGRALAGRVPGLSLPGFGPSAPCGRVLAEADRFQPRPLEVKSTEDDICVLIYTGGTTGRPKGVIHTHRVQVAMVMHELAEWDWPAEIRHLAMTPITHAAGVMILPIMLRSGTFVMAKGFDPQRFFELVERHRITSTFLVPTMIYVLLDSPQIETADYASLQLVIYGASPMAPARLEEGMKRFGPV